MENIFNIGGQVTGESFIGRKKELEDFRRQFVEPHTSRCVYSIVGLARSGKTSLVKNIFEGYVPKEVFYHYEDLSLDSTYYSIWFNVCDSLRFFLEYVDYSEPEQQKYLNKVKIQLSTILDVEVESPIDYGGMPWNKFQRTILDVFRTLKKLNIRSILIFDEFDAAQRTFKLGTSQFMLFRTLFADPNMSVSAVCVSRRKIETVEGQSYQSSTLSNVMNFYPLQGFNDDDMAEYYQVLLDKYQITVNDQIKNKIDFYAGRFPYLLSIIGHELAELPDKKKINVDDIFISKCHAIEKYYESCLEQLERDGYIPKIVPFVIGPKYGVCHNDAQILENLGYLSVTSDGRYQCLCPNFYYELSRRVMQRPIWDNIINLEKRLKELLIFRSRQIAIDLNIEENDINRAEKKILDGVVSAKEFETLNNFLKKGGTYFSVMSIGHTVRTIAHYWDKYFRKYFRNKNYSEYQYRLEKCISARNPIAHGHQDYLTDADINEVNSYCNEFFEILADNFPQNIIIPEEKELLSNRLQAWKNSQLQKKKNWQNRTDSNNKDSKQNK